MDLWLAQAYGITYEQGHLSLESLIQSPQPEPEAEPHAHCRHLGAQLDTAETKVVYQPQRGVH